MTGLRRGDQSSVPVVVRARRRAGRRHRAARRQPDVPAADRRLPVLRPVVCRRLRQDADRCVVDDARRRPPQPATDCLYRPVPGNHAPVLQVMVSIGRCYSSDDAGRRASGWMRHDNAAAAATLLLIGFD